MCGCVFQLTTLSAPPGCDKNGVPLRLRRYNRDTDDKFFQDERFRFSYIDPANDKTGEMFSVEETEKPPPYNTSYNV